MCSRCIGDVQVLAQPFVNQLLVEAPLIAHLVGRELSLCHQPIDRELIYIEILGDLFCREQSVWHKVKNVFRGLRVDRESVDNVDSRKISDSSQTEEIRASVGSCNHTEGGSRRQRI